jgi:quinol monooxygenase YgiN
MPIITVATVKPLPEHRDEVKAAFIAAIEQVHDEDGCELYALNQNDERLVMIEKWAGPAALKAHSASPTLQKLQAVLKGKLDGALEVVNLEPVPAGDPAKGQL